MEAGGFKRACAVPKSIAEIKGDEIRVRILGRVIDSADGVIVVDDGLGRAEIISDVTHPGSLVRIFCRVMQLEEGYELQAEIVQDMSKLDMDLYKKVLG